MPDNSRLFFAPWERNFERIATPFEEFLHRQTTTGVLLIACAIIALIIANTPLLVAYDRLKFSSSVRIYHGNLTTGDTVKRIWSSGPKRSGDST